MPQDDANAELINAISFDDESDANDVKEETVEQPTTPEESSTEETKETEAKDTDETESDEETSEDTDKEEADESDDEESKDEPKQKGKNKAQERIRSLANEKRDLQREVERLNALAYQPKTLEQLQDEGLSESDAKIEAMRQEQTVRDYNAHVVQLTSDLNMESMQVIHDMPVFDSSSKDYDKDFADNVADLYQAVSGIQTDENTGNIVQANVLPYDFYKKFEAIRSDAIKKGQLIGSKNARKSMAATESPSQSATKKSSTDPLMDALLAD